MNDSVDLVKNAIKQKKTIHTYEIPAGVWFLGNDPEVQKPGLTPWQYERSEHQEHFKNGLWRFRPLQIKIKGVP